MGITESIENPKAVLVVVFAGGIILAGVSAFVVVPVVGTFVLDSGSEEIPAGPEASFGVSFADGEATITHQGGDSLQAGNLVVIVGGEGATWAERGSSGTVSESDSLTVPTESGTRIELVHDGDQRVTLLSVTVG